VAAAADEYLVDGRRIVVDQRVDTGGWPLICTGAGIRTLVYWEYRS